MHATDLLHARFRTRLERAFAAPLDGIRIETGPAARRLIGQAGGRHGLAIEGRVFLADIRNLPVLVHELAHATQQRRPRAPDPAQTVEAEARAATAHVLAGGEHPIRASADPRDPALWGEAGHYYTVYFVALAAGAPEDDAYRIAFWAQAPDEVNNFDAFEGGVQIGKSTVRSGVLNAADKVPWVDMSGSLKREAELRAWWEAVHRGLHCLTGRAVADEQALRKKVSSQYVRPTGNRLIELGVSLHAFGDSYAHSKGDRMYSPPVGHGIDGHAPDRLSVLREKVYLTYVGALHDVLTTVYPAPSKPRLSRDGTVAALDTIIPPMPKVDVRCFVSDDEARAWERAMMPPTAANPPMGTAAFRTMCDRDIKAYNTALFPSDADERNQIQAIRKLATEKKIGTMKSYDPENKDALWLNAYKPPDDVGWYPGVETLVYRLIRQWAALK